MSERSIKFYYLNGTLGLSFVAFLNCQNFMILMLYILDFGNPRHTKLQFN